MSCNECKFAVFEDHGYSNWTVEGTQFYCGKKVHPKGSFDRFYGESKELLFGNTCTTKEVGKPIYIDVERSEVNSLTDEQKAIYDGV